MPPTESIHSPVSTLIIDPKRFVRTFLRLHKSIIASFAFSSNLLSPVNRLNVPNSSTNVPIAATFVFGLSVTGPCSRFTHPYGKFVFFSFLLILFALSSSKDFKSISPNVLAICNNEPSYSLFSPFLYMPSSPTLPTQTESNDGDVEISSCIILLHFLTPTLPPAKTCPDKRPPKIRMFASNTFTRMFRWFLSNRSGQCLDNQSTLFVNSVVFPTTANVLKLSIKLIATPSYSSSKYFLSPAFAPSSCNEFVFDFETGFNSSPGKANVLYPSNACSNIDLTFSA
mmetsp:Transcript_5831/g.17173  ORF Transcript_5831/g.17173 Transcript_5831/m.17173 type:complete len:284 (+) Transcript_5831:2454-3305(+)